MRCPILFEVTFAVALSTSAASALAGGAQGNWATIDGNATVHIAPCGKALCGTISSLRYPKGPGHIGERVLFGMQPSDATHWAGSAHNPVDGHDYTGSMVLAGNQLTTQGCAMGGLVCQSLIWTRKH